MWLVRVSRVFNGLTGSLMLADGNIVSRQQLEIIYGCDLTSMMINFSISISALQLSDGEVGIFTAVVLLSQGSLEFFIVFVHLSIQPVVYVANSKVLYVHYL